jgi:hypothetical protein
MHAGDFQCRLLLVLLTPLTALPDLHVSSDSTGMGETCFVTLLVLGGTLEMTCGVLRFSSSCLAGDFLVV